MPVFLFRYCLLLICLTGCVMAQPRFRGARENLGREVNDGFDQVQPVFSADGSTLYFSQGSGKNLQYEVWRTLTDSLGRITGKENVRVLNPLTDAPKYVLQALSSSRFLVSGAYEMEAGRLQYRRGVSAIDLQQAAAGFSPALFTRQPNPVLDAIFRRRNIFPAYHVFSRAFYWSEASDGQADLYFLPIGADAALSPIRLPDIINTRYQETTPWLDEEGRFLYFASDRPGGFGGLDIWVSERLDPSYLNWSKPVNLGPVVNTSKSDSHFLIDPAGAYAYLASDKNGYGRNDLCRIALVPPDSAAAISPVILAGDHPDTSVLISPATHMASNIVLLLDISHSMAESRKMVLLKKAMYRLVRQLRAADRISIVTFGSGVEVMLSQERVKDKTAVYDAIQLLHANGGATNIGAGLQRAYDQALHLLLPDGNNQVLLVTDGIFTLKPADEQLVLQHPELALTAVVVGKEEAVSEALGPLIRKANGQLLKLQDEMTDVNLLLQHVRSRARRKK